MMSGAPDTRGLSPRRAVAAVPRLVLPLLAVTMAAAALPVPAFAQLVAGPNINMVGGPASVTTTPTFKISGDPYLQRQNEPSVACSSRNPLNCLAAANDYRLVTAPGLPDGKVLGNAWLGVFWTHDGGSSWRSTMLPGFPQDTSTEGSTSPLKAFTAAADPTVRSGTSGLFYVSGIVFQPQNEPSAGSGPGGGGEPGQLFVATYIDDNNAQKADTPIRYLKTVVVDNGNNGQFLDKPWIAVDIPRKGAGSCTIPGTSDTNSQTVLAGNVYLAYSVFLGSGNNPHSKILFTKSTNCGQTWSTPVKLDESYATDQSAQITINPLTGEILVAWRNFGTSNLSTPNLVLVAKSSDGGNTFSKTVQVANLGLVNATSAYDQPTAPQAADPTLSTMRMFRTNAYPSACVDGNGKYWLTWAQLITDTNSPYKGLAQLKITSSGDGLTWGAPQPVEGSVGHQLMPSIACTGSQATLLWYDQRGDQLSLPTYFANYGYLLFDTIPFGVSPDPPRLIAHTIDVRMKQFTLGASGPSAAGPSSQVSRYQYALVNDDGTWTPVQLEFNPVNWPLFSGGTIPFIGDYLDLAPVAPFKTNVANSGAVTWAFNTANDGALQAAWTDNRDIPKPSIDDWSYTPARDGTACDPTKPPPTAPTPPPSQSFFNRNQNVYTSRIAPGIVLAVQGNSRLQVDANKVPVRAFAVTLQNGTSDTKTVTFSLESSPWGAGSFVKDASAVQLVADVSPRSTIARTVFVPASETRPVLVKAAASGVPSASAIINPDPNAPPPPSSTNIGTLELHTPSMSDAFVTSYQNPTFLNPTFLNPTFLNPTFLNPTFLNPTFLNPTFLNPTFLNPTFLNPTFLNPTFLNTAPTLDTTTTDVSWQITNSGNVATGYNFAAVLSSLPDGTPYQLIINRVYTTPSAGSCLDSAGNLLTNVQGPQYNAEILNVITSAVATAASGGNPPQDVSNATFALAAGDKAVVTLRLQQDAPPPDPKQFATQFAAVVIAQPANSDNSPAKAVYDKAAPVIAPTVNISVAATGPTGAIVNYTPPTTSDNVDGAGVASCTPATASLFPIGTTTVMCTATDSAGNKATATFTVTVADTTAPVISPVANITNVPATSSSGAVVTYTLPTVTDNVSTNLVATCSPAPGSVFAIGTTPVTCTATDGAGNQAVPVTFTVTVVSTATATATPNTLLWSPNKTLTPVTISGVFNAALPISNARYTTVDEYGTCQPTGSIVVNANGTFSVPVPLEAWRAGSDANGRVYTITVSGTDALNNVVKTTTTVLVPHNQ